MNIEQEMEIVRSLPSLYPMQKFEEEAINTVIDAIPHWIPCSERLPKVSYDHLGNWCSERVLCLMDYEEFDRVYAGVFNPIGVFETGDGGFIGRPVEHVIAWMPRPEFHW